MFTAWAYLSIDLRAHFLPISKCFGEKLSLVVLLMTHTYEKEHDID